MMVDNIYMSRREEDGRNSERRSGNRGEREAGALQIKLSFFFYGEREANHHNDDWQGGDCDGDGDGLTSQVRGGSISEKMNCTGEEEENIEEEEEEENIEEERGGRSSLGGKAGESSIINH